MNKLRFPNGHVPIVIEPTGRAAWEIRDFLQKWHRKNTGHNTKKAVYLGFEHKALVFMPPHITIVTHGRLTKRKFRAVDKFLNEYSRKAKPFRITLHGVTTSGKDILQFRVKGSKDLMMHHKALNRKLVDGKTFVKLGKYAPHLTILVDDRKNRDVRKFAKEFKRKIKWAFEAKAFALMAPVSKNKMNVVKRYPLLG